MNGKTDYDSMTIEELEEIAKVEPKNYDARGALLMKKMMQELKEKDTDFIFEDEEGMREYMESYNGEEDL